MVLERGGLGYRALAATVDPSNLVAQNSMSRHRPNRAKTAAHAGPAVSWRPLDSDRRVQSAGTVLVQPQSKEGRPSRGAKPQAYRGDLISAPSSGSASELSEAQTPYAAVELLAERLGMKTRSLLEIIGVTPRTAARRKASGQFKPKEADRVFRIIRVFDEAVRVFGSPRMAATWLRTSHPLLWQCAPARLLASDAGAKAVTDELIRIEFGDFV